MDAPEEPQSILDLDPDELDFLLMYRNLSPEHKNRLEDFIDEQIKDIIPER